MKVVNPTLFRAWLPLVLALITTLHTDAAQSFWESLLRITGISATPSQMKDAGDEMPEGGQIWIATVHGRQIRKLTDESGFRSPVFAPDGKSILALKSDEIWRIPLASGAAEKVCSIPGLSKLVGFSQDNPNLLCVLVEQEQDVSVQLLSLTTLQRTVLEYDKTSSDDHRRVSHLRGWEREYGMIRVYPWKQEKIGRSGEIEWNDILLKRADEAPLNVSQADGTNCGHPSLSPDSATVVFIKENGPEGR